MLAVLGLEATIVAQIAGLAYWLGRKFATIEERFREISAESTRGSRELSKGSRRLIGGSKGWNRA